MANSAQADWNVVHIVFGPSKDLSQPLHKKKKLVFSIGFSPWKCTPISSFRCHICVKTNGNWQQLQKFQNT